MPKGIVIRPSEVKAFVADPMYTSKMLLDNTNSDSQSFQINQGFIPPGVQHPDHAHEPPNDEVYIIIKGEGSVRLDGVEHEVQTGDVIYIPGGTMHAINNRSESEEMVIYSLWAQIPAKGVNSVYDDRLAAWGKTYKTIHEE